jgi:hypothetical protein
LTGIPKLGKHISVSQVVEKFKVVGSIARILLRQLEQNGALRSAEHHSKQGLYAPVAVAAEKTQVAATTEKEAGKKEKGAPKKEKK